VLSCYFVPVAALFRLALWSWYVCSGCVAILALSRIRSASGDVPCCATLFASVRDCQGTSRVVLLCPLSVIFSPRRCRSRCPCCVLTRCLRCCRAYSVVAGLVVGALRCNRAVCVSCVIVAGSLPGLRCGGRPCFCLYVLMVPSAFVFVARLWFFRCRSGVRFLAHWQLRIRLCGYVFGQVACVACLSVACQGCLRDAGAVAFCVCRRFSVVIILFLSVPPTMSGGRACSLLSFSLAGWVCLGGVPLLPLRWPVRFFSLGASLSLHALAAVRFRVGRRSVAFGGSAVVVVRGGLVIVFFASWVLGGCSPSFFGISRIPFFCCLCSPSSLLGCCRIG